MKKSFFSFLLICGLVLTSVNLVIADDETNQGSNLEVHLGYQNTALSFKDKSSSVPMWAIGGSYKYQKPFQLYARGAVDYSFGNKKIEENKHKIRLFNVEAFLGWTLPFAKGGMVSPFVGFGYHNERLFRNSDISDERSPGLGEPTCYAYSENNQTTLLKVDKYRDHADFSTSKYYGFFVKFGVDVQYMFKSNFSAGLIAQIGMLLSNKFKQGIETYSKISSSSYDQTCIQDPNITPNNVINKKTDSVKEKVENNFFFDFVVPVVYHVDAYKFGLRLSYTYLPLKVASKTALGKDMGGTVKRNTFGVALTAGGVF